MQHKIKMISNLKPVWREKHGAGWKLCCSCVFCITCSQNVFITLFSNEQMLRGISILFFCQRQQRFQTKITNRAGKVHYSFYSIFLFNNAKRMNINFLLRIISARNSFDLISFSHKCEACCGNFNICPRVENVPFHFSPQINEITVMWQDINVTLVGWKTSKICTTHIKY